MDKSLHKTVVKKLRRVKYSKTKSYDDIRSLITDNMLRSKLSHLRYIRTINYAKGFLLSILSD